ncbi:MAG: insulinase family protein [Planctomycetota bacterium]|nr:insulinase family protein [Planctomycetota bacterium]
MPFRSRYAVLSSLVLAAAVLSGAARGAELDPTAPLPVDPSVKMGALPNGMRYWIRKHATPPGKVGFWLHIGSGSLNESDDQRGLAHFLEHMAFNGSKNFAPGTLVKFFESLGMQFGADQNAFTSFDQTTYILTMPNVEPETISKGMTYFADVAYRLDLPPAEIDRERGVVLEEKRMRNGPQQRLQDKEFPVMLPGSLVPERMPIGTEEVLKAAQRERFEDYYKAWYRPEISTLIVVGDIDVAEMEQVIQDHFAGWPKGENPRAPADPKLKVYDSTRAAVFTDPEITRTEISVVSVRPKFEIKSIGDFRTDLVTDLGTWIFQPPHARTGPERQSALPARQRRRLGLP